MGPVFNSCTESDYKLLVQPQQRCERTSGKGRLRREDCKFVKHDKLFSKWKILMGPSEETDPPRMKDGTWKYHIHNLPVPHLGPGVYEIGVTAPSWTARAPNSQSLKREDVIPVYIGQAANIPQRLQKYGLQAAASRPFEVHQRKDLVGSRSPRMLQKGLKGGIPKSRQSGARLFSGAFSLGSSIVFRWAHTDSKVVAERVRSELLGVFDYAWNRGTSGSRRSRDILATLLSREKPTSSRSRILLSSTRRSFRWLFSCGRARKAVGIKVALRKPQTTCSMLTSLWFLKPVRSCTGTMPCVNAHPLRHYELANSPRKLRCEPVDTTSFSPGREFSSPDKDEAEETTAELQTGRRHNSLSFNTWMKGNSADQRVHDSSNMDTTCRASFRKIQGSERSSSLSRRVQHLGSKYASLCESDGMRLR